MRSPRKGRDLVAAAERIAARTRFQFEQREITKPASLELPRRGQSSNAAADHNNAGLGSVRNGRQLSISQGMPERIVTAHNGPAERASTKTPDHRRGADGTQG